MALKGIDVSYSQGNINWSAVKTSGIDFAMVKATQGRAVSSNSYLFTDRQFANNITNAHNVGIKCGVYHYLTAKTVKEAQTEAEHFCRTIEVYKPRIDLWTAVDVEEKKYLPRNKKLLAEIVNAFNTYVEAEGYKPIVYTNLDFLTGYLDYNSLNCQTIWRANWWYNDTTTFEAIPDSGKPKNYDDDMPIWQFGKCAEGYINGIDAEVDLNYGYFDGATPNITPNITTTPTFEEVYKPGDIVKVRVGRNYLYGSTRKFTVWFREYDVMSVKGDRVVIGKKGVVTAAVDADNLAIVRWADER